MRLKTNNIIDTFYNMIIHTIKTYDNGSNSLLKTIADNRF